MRDASFPSDSTECLGRFVGIAENVGHAMTYKILTDNDKIITRSVVRSARHGNGRENERARAMAKNNLPEELHPDLTGDPTLVPATDDSKDDSTMTPDQKAFHDSIKDDIIRSNRPRDVLDDGELPVIDVTDLLNRTFITNPDDNGEQVRAKIIGAEPTTETTADGRSVVYNFRCKHGEDVWNELVAYHKMMEWCERDADKDDMYKINGIKNHRKAPGGPTKWEVLLEWASGEVEWLPLSQVINDDFVTVCLYATKNKLLETPGWKRCKRVDRNPKMMARMIHQANLKNFRRKPVYKYGVQVPRNHEEAVFIDEKNGNTKWQDAEVIEVDQLKEYTAFKSLGLGAKVPDGYQKIPCHFVYDIKHDGRHKARFVAGGHRTETPVDSVYSGVVSLQGIRAVTFLAELNDLELWGTDVGNAYLESYTKEKICFIAGDEFGEMSGQIGRASCRER